MNSTRHRKYSFHLILFIHFFLYIFNSVFELVLCYLIIDVFSLFCFFELIHYLCIFG